MMHAMTGLPFSAIIMFYTPPLAYPPCVSDEWAFAAQTGCNTPAGAAY